MSLLANKLTYVVPVSTTHFERSVPLRRQFVQISVANDVKKSKAAFPKVSAPAFVKLERVWSRKVVPGSK